jgi:hypothetical protein
MSHMKLFSRGNHKIMKGEKKGYLSFILHLAPANLSGYNVCPKASVGCAAACLNTAGRGGIFKPGETTNVIQKARIRKTKLFFEDRQTFMSTLHNDIQKGIKQAEKKNMIPAFRLNGTSDISWEKYDIIQHYPNVQFYDYTKIRGRKVNHLKNYHLTFSKTDDNEKDTLLSIRKGANVAVVFRDKLPTTYMGMPVFPGDDSDLRFLDPVNSIIGLKAKGKAKNDTSGFVV